MQIHSKAWGHNTLDIMMISKVLKGLRLQAIRTKCVQYRGFECLTTNPSRLARPVIEAARSTLCPTKEGGSASFCLILRRSGAPDILIFHLWLLMYFCGPQHPSPWRCWHTRVVSWGPIASLDWIEGSLYIPPFHNICWNVGEEKRIKVAQSHYSMKGT